MERRRKLNLADLRVESFDTAAIAAVRGTVHGEQTGETCYVGCQDPCRNTRTSEHGWRSCDHSACWDYTCADPADSCQPGSYPIAC